MSEAALARGVRAASRTYGDFVASAPPDGPLGGHGGGASAEGAALDGARGLLAAEGRGGDTLLLAEQFRRFPKSGAGSLRDRAAVMRALTAIAAVAPPSRSEWPTAAGLASPAPSLRPAQVGSAASPAARGPASPAARAVVNTMYEVPEEELVREVVFALQGVDGAVVRWRSAHSAYEVDPRVGVTAPQRALMARLCEAGARARVVAAVAAHGGALAADGAHGACAAALAAAMRAELAQFDRLVAHLEVAANSGAAEPPQLQQADRELTLRRLAVWLAEPSADLATLARLVAVCAGRGGGDLLRVLHNEGQTGDPAARALCRKLLSAASAPLWAMLSHWLFEGELDDPCEEFFVAADPAVPDEYLWEMRYSLREGMLPPKELVPRSAAAAALTAGKAINFLRRCCGEAAPWEGASAGSEAASAAEKALREGDATGLARTVRAVGGVVNQRLMEVLFSDRFNLSAHLMALKRYLLLEQGDFVQALMDNVGSHLDQPAAEVSPFTLAGHLEAAVRASNAEADHPDVLARLRVRVAPPAGGESGWDVFSLEYAVKRPGAPLDPLPTVLDQQAMDKYARAFAMLWRLKRAEHAVAAAWALAKPSSALQRVGRQSGSATLRGVLQRMAAHRAALAHALAAAQHYLRGEALEAPWSAFQAACAQAGDLDALRAAHHDFLDAMLERALLGRGNEAPRRQLEALARGALRFRGLAERLAAAATEAAEWAEENGREERQRRRRGEWAAEEATEGAEVPEALVTAIANELAECEASTNSTLRSLMAMLAQHESPGLQGLVLAMDFGGFYRSAPSIGGT